MDSIKEILNICWNFLLTITIWDILDIAIISYLIYRVLLLVRKTNSANVIKGIIILIAALWISSLLKLSVVSYLLGSTFEFGFLALVILFQPEIRRFLEQVGSSNFKGLLGHKLYDSVINDTIAQTVMACEDMSRARIGALIVFERDNTLESYIKTGSLIDAEVATELLKNIFFPKAPLHDGAVIIRNNRIAGAACMLPLTNNSNLSRDLGMRHRAGVGMSERSDAVVVIVSEETGAISVAVDGMLKRHLSVETFEKLLRNEMMPDVEDQRGGKIAKKIRSFKSSRNSAGEK